MTYAELNFIAAEAIHRNVIAGNAVAAYQQGVEASLQRYGIDISDPESISYVTGVVSNFTGNGVRHIAIQRWLDQVNYGFEGYSVWSRMEFPVLFFGAGCGGNTGPHALLLFQ